MMIHIIRITMIIRSNGSDDDGLKAIDNKIDKPENSIT